MSLPLWTFSAIEKIDLSQAGNITIPYTIVLENGEVTAAYHTQSDATGPQHQRNQGSRAGGQDAGQHHTTTSSTFRHIYDCSVPTVLQGLSIADEAFEMEQRQSRRSTEIVAVLVEKVPPQESRRARKEPNSLLSVEYLTAQQTLNVIHRGASHIFPQSRSDTAESLEAHLAETHQRSHSSANNAAPPRARSGMLQRFDPLGEDFTTTIMVRWVRHEATTIIIPVTDDDKRRVTLRMECRRNRTQLSDRLAFPYQKCATVDGMRYLSEVVDPIPFAVEDTVLKASHAILREMNGEAQSIISAVLMFRAALHRPHASLPAVQFLYVAFTQMRSDVMVHPPLAFSVPAQYRFKRGGRPRPRSVHIYEEDLVEDVLPSAVHSPPRQRMIEHKANSTVTLDDSVSTQIPITATCVGKVLKQPSSFSAPTTTSSGTSSSTRQPTKEDFDEETLQMYQDVEASILHEPEVTVSGVPGRKQRSTSLNSGAMNRHSSNGMRSPSSQQGRDKSAAAAQREQAQRERAAQRLLRMVDADIPFTYDKHMADALHLNRRERRVLRTLSKEDHPSGGPTLSRESAAPTTVKHHSTSLSRSAISASPFLLDGQRMATAGVSSEKRLWFRSGATQPPAVISHKSPRKLRPLSKTPTPLQVHHDDGAVTTGDQRSRQNSGSPSQRSMLPSPASRSGATPPSSIAFKKVGGGGREHPSPSSGVLPVSSRPSSSSPTHRDQHRSPTADSSYIRDWPEATHGSMGRPSPRDASVGRAGSHEIPQLDDRDALLASVDAGHVSIAHILQALDARCALHLGRRPTTFEKLEYVVQWLGMEESEVETGPTVTPRARSVHREALSVLDKAVLLAADYAETIWYHLDCLALQSNPTASAAGAARLKLRNVADLSELGSIFSMSLAAELTDERAPASSPRRPQDESANVDDRDVAQQQVGNSDINTAPQQDLNNIEAPEWSSGPPAPLRTATPPPPPVPTEDDAAAVPETGEEPETPLPPADVSPAIHSDDHHEPLAQTNPPIISATIVHHGATVPAAVRDIQTALHHFIMSISSVRCLSRSLDDNHVLGTNTYQCSSHQQQLPPAILEAAMAECWPKITPIVQSLLVAEDRFAGWCTFATVQDVFDASMRVYGVAVGGAPNVADAELRASHWILGPLRELYVTLHRTQQHHQESFVGV